MDLDIKTLFITSIAGMVVALFTGKFLRKALVLIISPIVKKTKTLVDDELFAEARRDLGVTDDETDGK